MTDWLSKSWLLYKSAFSNALLILAQTVTRKCLPTWKKIKLMNFICLFICLFIAFLVFSPFGATFSELAIIATDSSLWSHNSGLLIFIALLLFLNPVWRASAQNFASCHWWLFIRRCYESKISFPGFSPQTKWRESWTQGNQKDIGSVWRFKVHVTLRITDFMISPDVFKGLALPRYFPSALNGADSD